MQCWSTNIQFQFETCFRLRIRGGHCIDWCLSYRLSMPSMWIDWKIFFWKERQETKSLSGWGAARRGVHRHVEQLLRRRRGLFCLLLWPDQCCIRRLHHECHVYQQHWCHFIHHYRCLQNFISMGDDDLYNLVSTMPHALSMSMWMWSGVARHRVLPQEVVRLWGFRQADGLRQADQPWARPENLDPPRPIYLTIYFCANSIWWNCGDILHKFCEFSNKLYPVKILKILWKYW